VLEVVSPPLRIAFVALCFPPDIGGCELYNFEYARRIHARGHALRLFTWGSGSSAERELDSALPFEVHREPMTLRRGAIRAGGLADWIGRASHDVVLVSRASKRLRRVVPIAARGGPLVLAVHDLGEKRRSRGPLGRWRVRRRYGFDRARCVVAVSEDTGRRVAALRIGVPISLAHPGVDTKTFAPDPLLRERAREQLGLEGRCVLLTVSRLAANKRHALVIDALPALRRRFPDLVYLIVGQGALDGALRARAAAAGVADIVRFAGAVADTRPYYAASDVFVMPSGRPSAGKAGEGFGISYVEAGACGLPVVASCSGGGAEIVVEGETGRVIDPEDPGALQEAIASLLADPAGARRLGEAARRSCERFDWERGVDRLVTTLREAAS